LFLAAGGPKTMRLAGEIADVVLLGAGLTEEVVRDSIGHVHDGARAAGRAPADVEIWSYAKIFLCDSEEQAWRDLAWTLAASAHHAFRFTLDGKFVPAEHRDALERLQREYVVREHNNLANVGTRNADLVIDTGLTEFLGPRFLMAGPPARVVERLAEIASWGVAGFFTSGMFGEPFAYTQAVADQVVARFR
jgi:5,10-methylenetetrahydromethanopterin reductase